MDELFRVVNGSWQSVPASRSVERPGAKPMVLALGTKTLWARPTLPDWASADRREHQVQPQPWAVNAGEE